MKDKNKNREGYKKTKVGWIPERWNSSCIGAVLALTKYGCSLPVIKNGNTPVVGMKNIKNGKILLSDLDHVSMRTKERATFLLKRNDVLINRTNSYHLVGKVGMFESDDEIGFVSYLVLLKGKQDVVTQKYLNYWLNCFPAQKAIKRIATKGVSQANVNPTVFKKHCYIPLPSLPEQKAIASVLECWDKAIQKYEEKIEKKMNIKKGLMQKLLSGEQRLPGFDGEWGETRLGMMGTFSKGKGISRKDTVESGLPCIRYGEIYTTDAFVLNEFESRISHETARLSRQITKNDLLFACSGETLEDIGKSIAYMGTEVAYAGGDIVVFSPSVNKAGSDFLAYYLNTRGRSELRRRGQGQSVVHIYSKHLESIAILLPKIYEQRAIASVLSSADSEIKALDKKLALLRDQKKYLLNNLVTGTIRLPKFCMDVG